MRLPLLRTNKIVVVLFSLLFFLFSTQLRAEEVGPPIQVKQGEVVSLTLTLKESARLVSGKFLDRPIPFFQLHPQISPNEFGVIIGIDLDQPAGSYPFSVAWREGESIENREYQINVIPASFGTEELTLPDSMVNPDPKSLARIKKEQERLKRIFDRSADRRFWEGEFIVPAEGNVKKTFGLRRIMNGEARNPHTGEDISAPLGTPVEASNGGKVILVDEFYFNGRSVVIDHGLGLFTMYFHLSEAFVKEGKMVKGGEQIGTVGKSGRATGPHLHWGARLNGARVNPFSLVGVK